LAVFSWEELDKSKMWLEQWNRRLSGETLTGKNTQRAWEFEFFTQLPQGCGKLRKKLREMLDIFPA
jgi:hypothetical protein